MKPILNKLLHKAKESLHSASALMKERLYELTGTSAVTVIQLADFIRNNPDTKVKRQDLLGQSFFFYQLEKEGIYYSLECKNSYILQLDVHSGGVQLVSYRSYRDYYSLNTPIKFPKISSN
ncbi:hypothetical protein F7731_20560 [Cytobacillus depressus]|uniref:Uncharacterized protein n=1 Tax=Cytobacillus depressus TaxID=1602942 RepID=A0A6L3V625_9BACI|nr:hypothetical protein [Cytobacillus depressus]KAB2330179.1 hypothetical protein F7731_20560 [Cytobacillus depressus]